MKNVPESSDKDSNSHGNDEEEASALIAALQSVNGGTLSIAQNFNDFFTHVGRESARKREQKYIEPFQFSNNDLTAIDNAVNRLLKDFDVGSNIAFDCDIGLENRRIISFQSIKEIEGLPDADKSPPASVTATWTYFFSIQWKQFSIPVPYKIQIKYITNPKENFVDAMVSAAAPEQLVLLEIQGPHRLIQSVNDELDALIKSTFLPPWWRYPKLALQFMEPYIRIAIYVAMVSTIIVALNNYEEWTGKPLLSQKTDEQLKQEIIANREEYHSKIKKENERRSQLLSSILNEKSIENKFDSYVTFRLEPEQPGTFTPIDELFEKKNVLPLLGYVFLVFMLAGVLHMLVLQIYKRLTPPSVIAIGRLGKRRMLLHRMYDWVAITLIGTAVLPALASIGAAIYQFFQT